MAYPSRPLADRFWAKVQKTPECWLWRGRRTNRGYGTLKCQKRYQLAHRLSWELACGPIPAGLCVCHHCDNPPCVRPDHLFLGTHLDNIADRTAKGRSKNAVEAMRVRRTKLSDDQVREIRRLYVPYQMTMEMLATQFATTKGYIRSIVSGQRRRHVSGEGN